MIDLMHLVLLQVTPLQGFLQWLNPQQQNPTFAVLPNYSQIAFVFLIIGLLFIGFRVYKNMTKFPIPENRVDTYEFMVQGYFNFRANISRDEEPLLDTTLAELETIDEIKEGIKCMREWSESKKIHLYQGIYSELENASHLRGEGSRFTILSPIDLADDDYFWFSKKQRWDWGTFRKENHRQIICLEPSMKRDSITIDKNEKDFWFLYPAKRPKLGEPNIFQSQIAELNPNKVEIKLNIIDPKYTEKIAQIFDWLVPLKEQQRILNTIDRTDKLSQNMVQKAYRIAASERVKGDLARTIAVKEPVYKILMEPKKPMIQDPILWMVFILFGAYIGSKLPQMVDSLRNTDPSVTTLIGGGIVIAIYLIFSSKKTNREKEDMEKVDKSEDLQK